MKQLFPSKSVSTFVEKVRKKEKRKKDMSQFIALSRAKWSEMTSFICKYPVSFIEE